MKKSNQISVAEYAHMRGVSAVAVTRAMNKGRKLIDVRHYEKYGRDWVLTICNNSSKINKGACVVIQK